MNKVWEHILSEIDFNQSKNIQFITSDDIKNSKNTWSGKKNQFEPRLLCKMDFSDSRPDIFKKNNICILSIENGKYALTKQNIYIKLPSYNSVPNKIIKKNNSLVLDIGNSEMKMLDTLLYNKVFDEIIGEEVQYGPLLGGRHRCYFETKLGNKTIHIKGSQYETDGCYETENFVCIVEAKSTKCTDFNIRQLYYPFREIHKKVNNKKKIISLFIYNDKSDIKIYKYEWNDYTKILDVNCTGYYHYTI